MLISCASTTSSCKSLRAALWASSLHLPLSSSRQHWSHHMPQRPFRRCQLAQAAGTDGLQRIAMARTLHCMVLDRRLGAQFPDARPPLALSTGFLMCVIGERGQRQPRACMYVCAGRGACLSSRALPCPAMRRDAMRCDAMRPSPSFLFLAASDAMPLSVGRASCRRRSKLTWWRRAEQQRGLHGRGLFCVWPHRAGFDTAQ